MGPLRCRGSAGGCLRAGPGGACVRTGIERACASALRIGGGGAPLRLRGASGSLAHRGKVVWKYARQCNHTQQRTLSDLALEPATSARHQRARCTAGMCVAGTPARASVASATVG